MYGLLPLPTKPGLSDDALLDALTNGRDDSLIAGWIDRGPWPAPHGTEHQLYDGWAYRLQRLTAGDLRGLPAEGEGGFPDLLFSEDRTWLLSLLWDDTWRSIGTNNDVAGSIASHCPQFEEVAPDKRLSEIGRHPH